MGSKMPKIGASTVKPTRLVFYRYLLRDRINYTTTHFADHSEDLSRVNIESENESFATISVTYCWLGFDSKLSLTKQAKTFIRLNTGC